MADMKRLVVVINGHEVGEVVQDGDGQMTFTYSESWRRSRSATPLSLSLPLVQARYGPRAVEPFLWGLLPDNQEVLNRWARRYGVSANNPFALLTHVGEDVAGAAQFVRESRLVESQDPGSIEEVSDNYIEERLRTLREDRASWTDIRGEFSLAGAQSKFALYRAPDGSWGIPHGRKATTHIFKPPLPGLADQEVNEHLCLQAASLLGMRTAISAVATFGSEQAIVLELSVWAVLEGSDAPAAPAVVAANAQKQAAIGDAQATGIISDELPPGELLALVLQLSLSGSAVSPALGPSVDLSMRRPSIVAAVRSLVERR